MKTFSISEAFSRGWTLFSRHKSVAILSTLIALAIGGFQNGKSNGMGGFFLWLLATAVSLLIQIGWWKIMLLIDEGHSPGLKTLFKETALFWKYVGLSILLAVMTMVGFIAFVIPGIYILLRYQFAPVILIDKGRSIGEAFRESARITSGWQLKLKLLAVLIAMGVVNFIGLLLFGVGLLVSVPVSMLAFIQVYRALSR